MDTVGVYRSVLLPAPSSASLLQSLGGHISLTDPEEQALSHKAMLGGGPLKGFSQILWVVSMHHVMRTFGSPETTSIH